MIYQGIFDMKPVFRSLLILFLWANLAQAQTDAQQVGPILNEEILSPHVSVFQLRQYLLQHVAKPPVPASAQQWTADSKRLRQHLLDVVFHGWPKAWVDAPPKFEDLGVIESGRGYRLRKLRYEIVPGFLSSAILYEPENLSSKVPAILNVNGHVGAPGKSVEYKQKRCINFAKRGILALNLEWLAFGELANKENEHGSGLIWTWWAQTKWDCSCWPCGKDSITSTIIPMSTAVDWASPACPVGDGRRLC